MRCASGRPGSERVPRAMPVRVRTERVLAIAGFSHEFETPATSEMEAKPVSARRRKSEPDRHSHARRVRYPGAREPAWGV
jgi:hypothetical protein